MADTDAIDARTAQNQLEDLLRDTIRNALGVRLPAAATVAALRARPTRGATGPLFDDDVLTTVGTSSKTGYRWSSLETAVDDGARVIKPVDGTASGRWVRWTSPLRYASAPNVDSVTLDQIESGPLRRVFVIDRDLDLDTVINLAEGQVPFAFIEASQDVPTDLTMDVGARWDTTFAFTVTVVTRNLRDRREAAQGSSVPNDAPDGANTLDGQIKTLLSGTQLAAALPGVRLVRLGRGWNRSSEDGQRRVARSREYEILATEEFPNAPNETAPIEGLDVQARLTEPDAERDEVDDDNQLTSGIAVPLGVGLTKAITVGSAIIDGNVVAFAGASVTFATYSDTYRDLNPDGTLTLVAVGDGSLPPEVTNGALRVGFTRTDAYGVTEDMLLCATVDDYGPRYEFDL